MAPKMAKAAQCSHHEGSKDREWPLLTSSLTTKVGKSKKGKQRNAVTAANANSTPSTASAAFALTHSSIVPCRAHGFPPISTQLQDRAGELGVRILCENTFLNFLTIPLIRDQEDSEVRGMNRSSSCPPSIAFTMWQLQLFCGRWSTSEQNIVTVTPSRPIDPERLQVKISTYHPPQSGESESTNGPRIVKQTLMRRPRAKGFSCGNGDLDMMRSTVNELHWNVRDSGTRRTSRWERAED